MSDRWTNRLSDYLDGELDPPERVALEDHLAGCPECAATLSDLREVVARARALEEHPPATDLWVGIAERIGTSGASRSGVINLEQARERRERSLGGATVRHVSLSLSRLAAACLAIAVVSGGAVWLVLSGKTGEAPVAGVAMQGSAEAGSRSDPAALAGTSPEVGTPAGGVAVANFAEPEYDAAVGDLERALAEGRGRLDPATIRVLEENLGIIDRALADARRALAADPANVYLNDHLARTMQRKLQLLRRANEIARA